MDFYSSFVPGTQPVRINMLTGVLAIIGWCCHAHSVYKMERTVHSKAKKGVRFVLHLHNENDDFMLNMKI